MRKFVAVDGESYTVRGEHRYVLLAASTGHYLYEDKGLASEQCFEFLLDQSKNGTVVAYGWNYDVNMMLRDLELRQLVRLWKLGRCKWRGYYIEWIPGKWFYLKKGNRRVKVFDVFGFFQASFVNALKKWGIEPQGEIETMKMERSSFDATMKQRVIEYCVGECVQLVELMDELDIALEAVELKVKTWVGAGAIASALLRRNHVQDFHVYDNVFPRPVEKALLRAYFGGRTELFQQGKFDRLYDYDISSAYPYEARRLPTLKDGHWRKVSDYDQRAEYALWECEWSLSGDFPVMPFPFRKGGSIYYPSRGSGYYHAPEVKAAINLHGDDIKIRGGYVFEPATDERPFEFIDEVYAYRKQMQRSGHGGEKVLKLGMNAIYGKLAQGYGYRGKEPPFQSYMWAGMITAGTRARILEAAALDVEHLVMVATDGIFYDREVDIELIDGLGGMELTIMDKVFVAQPGVYAATVDGERIGRSRGFFSREINFDDLEAGFEREGPRYKGHYPSHRFCGLGYCLNVDDFEQWRGWHDSERSLSLYPSRKFIRERDEHSNPVRHFPSHFNGDDAVSEPYKPKSSGLSDDEVEGMLSFMQGLDQPLKEYD